ncbi:hypothetical protein PO883_21620 [Massilia sp. DJPM01]|uniref:hypothetical protein n=1 Tax=Massilia sp. DJPM01 TaxID=3024404 RepID=UPI00259F094B|nr:hypothetical protein [Massilia sp. DJPM01]MDM5179794.1 hypothetical protein [Massilia sp. DJPM01]
MKRPPFKYIVGLAMFLGICSAQASKLRPEGTFIEQKLANRSQGYFEKILSSVALRGIHQLGEPVHEEITNRILGCNGDADMCGDPDLDPDNAYVLAGVRWNDDPPFRFEKGHGDFGGCESGATVRLVTFPQCWGNVFKDGERKAHAGRALTAETAPLLTRSHFGDMQYLHAMASNDNETAAVVRQRILSWAEFTWRVGAGEFPNAMLVKDVPIEAISRDFRTKGWSIQDLFALGNPYVRKPENMSKLAFGSFLHMLQDSFADGHAERGSTDGMTTCGPTLPLKSPGQIVEFHSYVHQDSKKHGEDDSRIAFSTSWNARSPNVVDVGRVFNEYFLRKASWAEVKPYVECVFAIHPDARNSSPGDKYVISQR